jgi:hypothetical protein
MSSASAPVTRSFGARDTESARPDDGLGRFRTPFEYGEVAGKMDAVLVGESASHRPPPPR